MKEQISSIFSFLFFFPFQKSIIINEVTNNKEESTEVVVGEAESGSSQREKEREEPLGTHLCVCVYIYIHIDFTPAGLVLQ